MILTMRCLAWVAAGILLLGGRACGQGAFTWQQIRERFEQSNPSLKAAQISIDESRAEETTAYLRPNPDLTVATDGTQLTPYKGVWQPFAGTQLTTSVGYLHERRHKRELRRDAAQESTAVTASTTSDQERSLIFTLRSAFVQVLQAKAVLQNAKENLDYWDRELMINRTRYQAGAISQMDFNRQELQRVQFESDLETATVNLRSAKVQLLMLLNDRTPVEQFDVTGPYDFPDSLEPVQTFENVALQSRPDLQAARQSVQLAAISYRLAVAHGSTDPTYSAWYSRNPSFNNPYAFNTLGASVSIPLRVFDRNQGEKTRTLLDIRRNEQLRDVSNAQVLSDVDSAYVTLTGALDLLRPYKAKYLLLAIEVRDTTAFAYRHGSASLLDYLDAEKSYRDTRLAYLNLIGSYLTAAAQMNAAVGRDVIQ